MGSICCGASEPKPNFLTEDNKPKELKTNEEFDAFMEANGDRLVVVDYTAEWCGPCQEIKPHFEKLAGEIINEVTLVKVDHESGSEIINSKGVRGYPTFRFYKGGEQLDQMQGANFEGLKARIDEFK